MPVAIIGYFRLKLVSKWVSWNYGWPSADGIANVFSYEFFDLKNVTIFDILAIVIISTTIPLFDNLILAVFVGKIRLFLSSSLVVKSINKVSGLLLIMVGLMIPFVWFWKPWNCWALDGKSKGRFLITIHLFYDGNLIISAMTSDGLQNINTSWSFLRVLNL